MTPFLTIYLPYWKLENGLLARPVSLARAHGSVLSQALPPNVTIQPLFVEDTHPGGSGVGGMVAQVPANAHKVRGDYVVFLADDDELAWGDVVVKLYALIEANDRPDVVIVSTDKAHHGRLPYDIQGPPISGRIDLNCVVTRRDVWLQHVHDYGHSYEGDYQHVAAMWDAGRRFLWTSESTGLLFSRGAVSGGRAEA